jgi:hypothetical protein
MRINQSRNRLGDKDSRRRLPCAESRSQSFRRGERDRLRSRSRLRLRLRLRGFFLRGLFERRGLRERDLVDSFLSFFSFLSFLSFLSFRLSFFNSLSRFFISWSSPKSLATSRWSDTKPSPNLPRCQQTADSQNRETYLHVLEGGGVS